MAETLHEMAVRMVKGEDCQPQCGKGCGKCPAGRLRSENGVCLVRRIANVDNCEEQIEGLKAWAKEHPEPVYPSWYEYQQQTFPGHSRWICPMAFGVPCQCKSVTSVQACTKCRNSPIPADIAAKLGIRPM